MEEEIYTKSLCYTWQWCHNERDGVSNHRRLDCLLNRLLRCRSNKISKLRVTGLCEENFPMTGEFPAQRASNTENVCIWGRHRFHSVNLQMGQWTKTLGWQGYTMNAFIDHTSSEKTSYRKTSRCLEVAPFGCWCDRLVMVKRNKLAALLTASNFREILL